MDNIPHSPTPAVSLDNVPILVLHTIVSHLDIGDVIPLIQVNRRFRYSLTSDNGYWVFLLRTRLNVKLSDKRWDNAVLEFIMRLPTLRCADCHTMQLPRRHFFEPFWNRPLCDVCRMDDKYRLVTAYTAKKNYFLDENDLLRLRTFSKRNPHHKNASHARFFSQVNVQRRSELKLGRLRTTRIERLRKRDLRSRQAKDRWRQQVANRREQIIQLLTAKGFPSASTHYCTAVDGFVRNLLIRS
jgi:hypothetical protein